MQDQMEIPVPPTVDQPEAKIPVPPTVDQPETKKPTAPETMMDAFQITQRIDLYFLNPTQFISKLWPIRGDSVTAEFIAGATVSFSRLQKMRRNPKELMAHFWTHDKSRVHQSKLRRLEEQDSDDRPRYVYWKQVMIVLAQLVGCREVTEKACVQYVEELLTMHDSPTRILQFTRGLSQQYVDGVVAAARHHRVELKFLYKLPRGKASDGIIFDNLVPLSILAVAEEYFANKWHNASKNIVLDFKLVATKAWLHKTLSYCQGDLSKARDCFGRGTSMEKYKKDQNECLEMESHSHREYLLEQFASKYHHRS
jgi:hypothetical protein